MFCNNASYDTYIKDPGQANYFCQNQNRNQALPYNNYLTTQQSQVNASNLYQNINSQRQLQPSNSLRYDMNQHQAMELMDQNKRRQNKKLQAVQRNKYISTIMSIVLAFSQKIQGLKQKICGYPAQSFSPVQFFNILDLSQKGHVDIYDIKRFINNDKIRQKDIISLFKKVNGDHAKENTRLNYFGYLNLIKPYFNQQLAKDLLMRDTIAAKKRVKSQDRHNFPKIDNQLIEPTQQSVLLLFQELIVLHCICTAQHQQAKQLLMNEYMLNTVQIRQILGLDDLELYSKSIGNSLSASRNDHKVKHKSPLWMFFRFIENNSQFKIQFQEMKYLLSFLNVHEFSLPNDKYLALLFLPTNCKAQILKQVNRNRQSIQEQEGSPNYMNTYLNRQNLMSKGDIRTIREYLGEKAHDNTNPQHSRTAGQGLGGAKVNFLQFVHPRSLQRAQGNMQFIQPQSIRSPMIGNQHPSLYINASNKYPSEQQRTLIIENQISQRQLPNNSRIPQQNVRVNDPKLNLSRNNNSSYGLKNQFYEQRKDYEQQNQGNVSVISKTPFLQQFMKQANVIKNITKYNQFGQKIKVGNFNQPQLEDSSLVSNSAFQVVDYGYEAQVSKGRSKNLRAHQQPYDSRYKIQGLDSRYNLVVSQYNNSKYEGGALQNTNKNGQSRNNLFKIDQNQSYSKNQNSQSRHNLFKIDQNQSYQKNQYPTHTKNKMLGYNLGPKFQKQTNKSQLGVYNPILNYSNSNYIDAVGMSQSNMVNQSNLHHTNSIGSRNILDDFLKK